MESGIGTGGTLLDAFGAAEKIQRAASALGFDWPDVEGVFAKVEEEIGEIREALDNGDAAHAKSELGDLLFAVVNLSRFVSADPSAELLLATERFERRFSLLRNEFDRLGKRMEECSLEELDVVWEEVKRRESIGGKMS